MNETRFSKGGGFDGGTKKAVYWRYEAALYRNKNASHNPSRFIQMLTDDDSVV